MIVLSVWTTIGSIALFILALSVLIVIHELGHFIAAKSFKVYCSDFSIGFGPKFVKIKRKKGETTFNMGVIPLGGYVSMYGEGVELPDGKKIPRDRSLNGINRWKRAIIMAAGIFMNFVLAYVIFFISASCFPQYTYYVNSLKVMNEEKYNSELRVTDETSGEAFVFGDNDIISVKDYLVKVDDKFTPVPTLLTYKSENTVLENEDFEPVVVKKNIDGNDVYYTFALAYSSPKQTEDLANGIIIFEAVEYKAEDVKYYKHDAENKPVEANFPRNIYLPKITEGKITPVKITEETNFEPVINVGRVSEEAEVQTPSYLPVKLKLTGTKDGKLNPLYAGAKHDKYWNGWKSFEVAGKQWVDSTGAVANALGGLFVGKNWDQVGGPLAIFNQSSMILEEFPFSQYLNVWGIISVNLALFNLLPFPGLDGWQLLVTGIEGTVNLFTRAKYRKTYEKGKDKKVKNKPEDENTTDNITETTDSSKEVLAADTDVKPVVLYDKDLLVTLRTLNENILEIETNYFYQFNKKYDHEALSNAFSDPEMIDEYRLNKEYKYFEEHNNAVHDYDEFVLLNNLNDVKPYKEWGIPEKVKNIVSYIGLALLMALAAVIFIMDIIKMVK